ncbi:MAG: DUF932 domain-containing protein, partial [Gammaproteobacteria bacterium]|nr:DUF932 domain-containing protein [Gammaproteobacteria bacterium]
LAARKVSATEAQAFFRDVICKTDEPVGERCKLPNHRALQRVHQLYGGAGRGSELATAKGTAWGLLNAVTEFVDHERRSRSSDYRLDSAWFGQGAQLKSEALEAALALAA